MKVRIWMITITFLLGHKLLCKFTPKFHLTFLTQLLASVIELKKTRLVKNYECKAKVGFAFTALISLLFVCRLISTCLLNSYGFLNLFFTVLLYCKCVKCKVKVLFMHVNTNIKI